MLYRQLILACLMTSVSSYAQIAGITPIIKNTENAADAKIDYKVPGTTMPSFLLIVPGDSSWKNEAKGSSKKDVKAIAKDGEGRQQTVEKHMTSKEFDNGANLFVMLFNPTCSHCEEETNMLEKNIGLFKKSKLVLMANKVMKPYMADFIKSNHTNEYAPIYVGTDSLGFIDQVFLYQALPQINIYDSDRKLLKIFSGEVSIDSLAKYIQ